MQMQVGPAISGWKVDEWSTVSRRGWIGEGQLFGNQLMEAAAI